MAAKLGAKGPQADINVTPLVDIVLVLLIIFMVITPLLAKSIPVEVPQKADFEDPLDEIKDQVVLKLFADGHIEVNKETVAVEELELLLSDLYADRSEKVMFFEGEDDARYGGAVTLMDLARGAGVETIGIMTPNDDVAPAAGPFPEIDGEAPAPLAPE
jgi:biopolymer transport protein ExbD